MAEIYDAIVVGRGPVGVIASFELLAQGKKVLNIDAGIGVKYLQSLINFKSNLNYTGVEKLPSLNPDFSNYLWGGACMGWHDFSNKSDSLLMPYLPIEKQLFEKQQNRIAKILGLDDFNFDLDLPKKVKNSNSNLYEIVFAKIIKDPYLRNLINDLESKSRYTFNSNFLIKSIKSLKGNLEILTINYPSFNNTKIIAKELFLAAGTLENTRILLSNSKELGLEDNAYLGKNLSDHYSINIAKIFSKNFTALAQDFDYRFDKNGTRLWPRVRLRNINYKESEIRSFAYFTEFNYNTAPLKIVEYIERKMSPTLAKLVRSEGTAMINLFVEAENSESNKIEILNGNQDTIPKMRLDFNISEEEILNIGAISTDLLYWFKGGYNGSKRENSVITLNSVKAHKIQTRSHPSGTYRISDSKNYGVVNKNSRLWSDSRIAVLGSGAFPRSVATHPTFPSMVTASISVANE